MVVGQVAPLVAALCVRFAIPPTFVSANGLRQGQRGVTTHAECVKVWGGDHWDPGPDYPMDVLLAEGRRLMSGTVIDEETEMGQALDTIAQWEKDTRTVVVPRLIRDDAGVDWLVQVTDAGIVRTRTNVGLVEVLRAAQVASTGYPVARSSMSAAARTAFDAIKVV